MAARRSAGLCACMTEPSGRLAAEPGPRARPSKVFAIAAGRGHQHATGHIGGKIGQRRGARAACKLPMTAMGPPGSRPGGPCRFTVPTHPRAPPKATGHSGKVHGVNADQDLEEQHRIWEEWAQADPLWAILSDPTRKGGKWELSEFFASGERDVDNVMEETAQRVAIQLGVRAGGSQGPVVKSSVSAWYLSLPHLWAVAR